MKLSNIQSPSAVKALSEQELEKLAGEIREEIIRTVSENGGHLASNLGAGELTTAAGETLSWQYLRYVREHPVRWNADTAILYGENDALVPFETVKAFADSVGASLTVMPGGEHWFHTPEQLRFLEAWLEKDER